MTNEEAKRIRGRMLLIIPGMILAIIGGLCWLVGGLAG